MSGETRARSNSLVAALPRRSASARPRSSTATLSLALAGAGKKETLLSKAFAQRFQQAKADMVQQSTPRDGEHGEERYVVTSQGVRKVKPPTEISPNSFFRESEEWDNADDSNMFTLDEVRRASTGQLKAKSARDEEPPPLSPGRLLCNDDAVHALLNDRVDEMAWGKAMAAVQNGISSTMRNRMWLLFSLTEDNVQVPSLDALVDGALLDPEIYTELRRDISRISHGAPSLDEARRYCAVYRVMVAYYSSTKHSEYTHSINNMAYVVVNEVHSPDNWLPVLRSLLRSFVPFYTCGAMPGAHADADLLQFYLRTRCPKLVQHFVSQFNMSVDDESNEIVELNDMVLQATMTYFSSGFAQSLHSSAVATLWDNAFLRGPRVFFEFWIKLYIYAYRRRWTLAVTSWVEFHAMLATRLADMHKTRHSLRKVLAEHLPGKEIDSEEFRIRRAGALLARIRL